MAGESRDFPIGDILSITTGRMLAPDGIGAVYRLLNHMTGDNLFTHQLGRAAEGCVPFLLGQHPQLAGIDAEGVDESNCQAWLAAQAARFGERLPVAPIPAAAHARVDPVEELIDMMGPDKVIVVTTDGGGEPPCPA